mgnify:CR=1 FL=1
MKKIFFVLFIFSIFSLARLTAFAWWDSVDVEENAILSIGEGVNMISVKIDDTDKTLVPSGSLLKENDSYELKKTYEVYLDKDVVSPLELIVYYEDLLIGDSSFYNHLLNIEIVKSSQEIDLNTSSIVEIIITLNMPNNEEEYIYISENKITLNIIFEAI